MKLIANNELKKVIVEEMIKNDSFQNMIKNFSELNASLDDIIKGLKNVNDKAKR